MVSPLIPMAMPEAYGTAAAATMLLGILETNACSI
jgi:hypothetical protein